MAYPSPQMNSDSRGPSTSSSRHFSRLLFLLPPLPPPQLLDILPAVLIPPDAASIDTLNLIKLDVVDMAAERTPWRCS
ncbi:hypothetical protein Hypma_002256 [Hypsizygus marmoreus]|uniref:Uncharacterized protein n=1 Tax=Hypsizygus marmoreus TaxID=39966 RepID=A0A369K315_HYPMA|nr:hypothetical protein Hypma_002256 [Hypsizygus marmoreus]